MRPRRVVRSARLDAASPSPGFVARSLRSSMLDLDPFLSIDEFHMSRPTFPPHPHAGFSAVTYLFEESKGAFVNRDSLGDRSRIGPGALHWTQAGRGMMHEEIPEEPGVDCHGLQMFVNLARADKMAPPAAFHVDAEQVPVHETEGARIRVLSGSLYGKTAPLLELRTKVLLLDVSLEPGARLVLDVPPNDTLFALAVAGDGTADPEGALLSSREGSSARAVGFSADGTTIVLTANSGGLHVVVGGGRPIGEPVVFGGPFAMNDAEQIQDAFERYRRGDMGRLAPSFTRGS